MHAKDKSVIKSFSFQAFDTGEAIKDFSFNDLSNGNLQAKKVEDRVIRVERQLEKDKNFHIYDMVREHRGINAQEQNDYEERVNKEVARILETVRDEAYQDGFKRGQDDGHKEAHKTATQIFAKQIEEMRGLIENTQHHRAVQLEENKAEIYKMIKTLVKWVAMKEMSELSYLPKLLEKMILELNERHNLLIKISDETMERMPDVITTLEGRLGQLTNVRVEVSNDLKGPGLVLESEKGILDASLEVQFKSIDKLFESVGVEIDHPGVE